MTDVFKTGWITQGPAISVFEQKVARHVGAQHAVVVANGTAALHIAYLAAGIKKGDEVITTPNTFAATTNMLLAIGAKPVFCDIRLDTYNIDEKQIEKYVTKKTKAIVPVHFSGHPCDMNAIWRVARKHRLLVIEDGAQALGAKYRGKYVGSGGSDMVTYSFHPVKAITTGEGGMVVTNDIKLHERLLLFRNHGITKDSKGFNVMTHLGYNYRMTDMSAALGCTQLAKLDMLSQKRARIVKKYMKKLKTVSGIILP
ncbi:MAG: DegT/DnrJ/EryC1/StrS family aminotransferase, partial [Patescibacteria group bacterium]